MIIGKYEIRAQRWPWQPGYDWKGIVNSNAPLNPGGARFGGGWKYALGIEIGGDTIIINLLFGMIRINRVRRSA